MLIKPLEEIFPSVPTDIDVSVLDLGNIPAHIAVIMDGNGRWAKNRTLNRIKGHKAGIEAVRETIRTSSDLGVRFLTIYSFSTENWARPKDEVEGLMDLFAKTMLAEVDELHSEGVRVLAIGDMSILPDETRIAFDQAQEKTKGNSGMTLVVAINYGGRAEITRAANLCFLEKLRRAGTDGLSADAVSVDEGDIASHLYTAGIPDPELVIRTSGEMRLSNFLLWQSAYAELVCTEVLWPDFDRYELLRCLLDFQSRERRFGGV